MLDRSKIIKEIENATGKLFALHENQVDIAFVKWQKIAQIQHFQERVINSESSFLLPGWQGKLDSIKKINYDPKVAPHYAVLAVDGSQIYPERHISGINCFALNIGQCLLEYSQKSRVVLNCEPKVLTFDQAIPDNEEKFSIDLVDFKREELELNSALKRAIALHQSYRQQNFPFTVLFDGSLIFWQLEGKHPDIKKYFLDQYIHALDGFYQHNIPIASYISMPKSRELVNLTKIGFCRFEMANCIRCHSIYQTFPCKDVEHVIDTQLCQKFLNEFEMTTIFQSNSKIAENYPQHLKPCFLYLNIGQEIIRLEFPQWMSQNEEYITLICKIAIDQATKGHGYSVALAEAHEQAVIKAPDREFFYHLINKKSIELRQKIFMSPKNLKKCTSSF